MKRLVTFALLAAIVALTSPVSAAEKKLKMGYTTMDLANPYFVTLTKGLKDRADELGIKMTVHDAKSDAASQVTAMENFIAQQMDVIIVSPIDPNALTHMIKQAHEANIPVVNPNQEVKGNDAFISLIEREYGLVGGRIAGQWIKDKLNGEAEVAILSFPEMQALMDRTQGLIDGVLEIAPKAKIVSEQSANTPERGMKAAETIMQSNPNVKVIVGHNDAGALGAMEAVKAMGKDSDDFCIVGLDATPEAIAKMKLPGSIYRGTVDIDPYGTGGLIVDTSVKVLETGPISEMVRLPMIPVTSANIDKY